MNHQTQPTPFTCVHTCIAMVLGRPVKEIIEEVGLPHGMTQLDLVNALERYNLAYAMTAFHALWYGWQFVSAPSRNVRGGSHQILVHYSEGEYRVLDPSPKIRYKENGSDLTTWINVILVKPKINP